MVVLGRPTMKLFIPVLCYGYHAHAGFMFSLMKLIMYLRDAGIKAVMFPICFESLVSRARNAAAAHFLTDTDATHMLFIDSDIEFEAEDVVRMIRADKPVIAAGYPQKWLSEPLMRKVFNDPQAATLPAPLELCTKHSVHILPNQPVADIMQANYVTTGFLLIKKEVFTKLKEAYPNAKYRNDIDAYMSADANSFYDFFPVSIHPETRRYESEDYGFCRLWRQTGGEIFVLTNVTLKHHGWYAFSGNIWRQVQYHAANTPSKGEEEDAPAA